MTKKELILSNIIHGEQQPPSSQSYFDSVNPSTGSVFAKIPASNKDDVDAAVYSAVEGASSWGKLTSAVRADYLRQIHDHILLHGQELAKLETVDNGWVIRETEYGLIPSLASIWLDAINAAISGTKGETINAGEDIVAYTIREPYGVVAAIIPWNAPLFTFTIKAAYALAAGNSIVVKPSELAAVSSLRYGELINEILPPGVLNVISGDGKDVGAHLVSHPLVDKISLTGSGATASAIARSTADSPKSMILELGGKSPHIIFDDAAIQQAAFGLTLNGIFTGNAGQLCVGGSRIYVQRGIYDEVIAAVRQIVSAEIPLGDTENPLSAMGPIANAAHYNKVRSYIELAKEEGAKVLIGGHSGGEVVHPDNPKLAHGYWLEPTLLEVTSNKLRICQEEVFGPVATIQVFDTEEEVLALANDTEFGLGAGLWTNDLHRANRLIRQIKSGSVWVNDFRRVGPELPFGGFKKSGFGTDSVAEFTRNKTVYVKINQ
ncbi:aldehyde dehydrogenase [Kurthia sibirica]|uniref:Aldehyde dehydrogenase n=2 Tax=Kurthia sibirica TaxID=202750 RepID=A0A2U3ALL7_9BACL|nr:aldehyde dehydrogenase [Kurthia sibirica]